MVELIYLKVQFNKTTPILKQGLFGGSLKDGFS